MVWFMHNIPGNVEAPADVDAVVCSANDVMLESMTVTYAFVVPAPLDVAKLRESLFVAISTKLPRAGARLAKRNGLFEFQIPKAFSAEVPPAGFTSINHNAPFPHEKYGIPPQLPSDAKVPFVMDFKGQDSIRLFRGPGTPQETKAFLKPNTPAVHAHVAVYNDTTLLGITASHIMGRQHA